MTKNSLENELDNTMEAPSFNNHEHSENKPISNTSKSPSRRRSGPKVFRCTGYGDCNMVFTRQEHLNRHERKHTGEKPYQCFVEGCNRMFTRNDNMRQHAERCPYKNPDGFTNKRGKDSKSGYERLSNKRNSTTRTNPERATKRHKYYSEEDSESSETAADETFSLVDDRRSLSPLPYKPHLQSSRSRVAPRVIFASHKRSYNKQVDAKAVDSDFSTFLPNTCKPRRRLSAQDLFSSIDRLEDISNSSNSDEDDVVDLTEDEFEALIGFREFHKAAVTM
ncbi:hypothetical protein G6F46_011552 [Rhizopus delemar]|uniref:C2H2-type domain-containing protein n=2 Tax=Rhizopus TaxID=4842 RepID=A0A9P6YY06_9FUNG|nr:hypothetical protein G6F55_011088 [Rhizopus delemar]KAG1535268.1 hypothetical protein G6F51_011633 [Rhizopus arrhizus]KAG1489653.1 hypothetical protein G6F54_011281 [Rhizopus delemar]KAG1499936.1 hypothetical protein G6F53_011412 [Rhizopus delemar]KAG1515736.1 hypothetical protein G6F52_009607 [Rhizopus delemar]